MDKHSKHNKLFAIDSEKKNVENQKLTNNKTHLSDIT